MEYRLKKVDLLNGSEDELMDMVRIVKRIQAQIFPDDPIEPDEVVKTQLLVMMDPKEVVVHAFIIYEKDNDNMIGFCFYAWFAEGSERAQGNETFSIIEIQIDPKYRKKGIGGSVYDTVLPKLKEAGKNIVMINSNEEDGKRFLKQRGFKFALKQPIYRAKFEDIDWDMIDEWKREGEQQNPQTELRIYDKFPEDIIDAYSKTYTKTHEQIPRGELQMQDMEYTPEFLRESYDKGTKMGYTRITGVIVEKSGEVSGFAYLNYSPTREPIVDIGITAVLEEARGRKLGKWLKAATMLAVKSRYPGVNQIRTDVATSNAPMIYINEKIGFKLYKERIMAQKILE